MVWRKTFDIPTLLGRKKRFFGGGSLVLEEFHGNSGRIASSEPLLRCLLPSSIWLTRGCRLSEGRQIILTVQVELYLSPPRVNISHEAQTQEQASTKFPSFLTGTVYSMTHENSFCSVQMSWWSSSSERGPLRAARWTLKTAE